MEEEKRYFYQPDLTSAIIQWCWMLLIGIAGVVVWLEITHFNWITALLLALFIILAVLAIGRRAVLVTPTKMVFDRMLQNRFLVIPLKFIRVFLLNAEYRTCTSAEEGFCLQNE